MQICDDPACSLSVLFDVSYALLPAAYRIIVPSRISKKIRGHCSASASVSCCLVPRISCVPIPRSAQIACSISIIFFTSLVVNRLGLARLHDGGKREDWIWGWVSWVVSVVSGEWLRSLLLIRGLRTCPHGDWFSGQHARHKGGCQPPV